jgi:hypothetical protein
MHHGAHNDSGLTFQALTNGANFEGRMGTKKRAGMRSLNTGCRNVAKLAQWKSPVTLHVRHCVSAGSSVSCDVPASIYPNDLEKVTRARLSGAALAASVSVLCVFANALLGWE